MEGCSSPEVLGAVSMVVGGGCICISCATENQNMYLYLKQNRFTSHGSQFTGDLNFLQYYRTFCKGTARVETNCELSFGSEVQDNSPTKEIITQIQLIFH
jgi:hypothetical protein